MASRDMRYSWFKSILNQNGYNYIVTAHHEDDNIETILFNFIKTTGYKGLIGIPKSSNKILRPLINIKKREILSYAKKNNIIWRDDESNYDNKYVRNKIRNTPKAHFTPDLQSALAAIMFQDVLFPNFEVHLVGSHRG